MGRRKLAESPDTRFMRLDAEANNMSCTSRCEIVPKRLVSPLSTTQVLGVIGTLVGRCYLKGSSHR